MKRLCLVSKHAWEPADVAKGTVALPQKKSEFILFFGGTQLGFCRCAHVRGVLLSLLTLLLLCHLPMHLALSNRRPDGEIP